MKSFLRKHEKLIFIFFDIALNGFNYLFHIVVSRFISGNDYGRFNALISMASILFVTRSCLSKLYVPNPFTGNKNPPGNAQCRIECDYILNYHLYNSPAIPKAPSKFP